MTTRHTLVLGLAAALFSITAAGTADAATVHHRMMHHSMHSRAHMGRSATAMPTDADHSADSLNAQSLTRAQGAAQ